MEYFTNYIWERNGREINEDSLAINQVMINNQPLLMGVVCDGIGSLEEGELASSFVVSCLKNQFEKAGKRGDVTLRKLGHVLCRELYSCHEALKQRNTGTTVSIVIIYKTKMRTLSVGDSRIYAGKRKMKLLTKDTSDNQGRLTAAIGVGKYKRIKWNRGHFGGKSRVLLCSDGFYRRNQKIICRTDFFGGRIGEQEMKERLETINAEGVVKGERDNASAVIIWRN